MDKPSEKGQILLIVVLIMVVALTIGLSLAARSITNIKIATDDENSQRAFSAAEAGVERLIKSDCTNECNLSSQQFDNSTTFTAKATQIAGNSLLVKGGIEIKRDEGADIWLSNYSSDPTLIYGSPQSGTVTIYWGDSASNCNTNAPAALHIIVFHGDKVNPQIDQYGVDPCPARRGQNNFILANAGGSVDTETFSYSYQFTVAYGIFVRVIPIYKNTSMGVKGGTDGSGNTVVFPSQGKQIEASGQSAGTVRKITFVQSFPLIPAELVQYGLISAL